jgi:Tol biopolymer transport system component
MQVIDRVIVRGGGAVELAVADNGTVAYVEGTADDHLVVVDQTGRSESLSDERKRFVRPRMSPDGARVVLAIRDPSNSSSDVWILDVASKGMRRITNDGKSGGAWWGANGHSLIWQYFDGDRTEIRSQLLDGRSAVETLYSSPATPDSGIAAIVVDRSGQWILAIVGVARSNADIVAARLGSRLVFRPIAATSALEMMPALSPDGQRLAFSSNESGRGEVYVTSFPEPSTKLRVSYGGAGDPMWSRDGRTLYHRSTGARMVAVRFNPSFTTFTSDTLFSLDRYPRSVVGPLNASFDITPDDKFLMTQSDQARRLVMVLSFAEELRQRFAETGRR